MKTVIAYIKPFKEDAVRDALHDIPGVSGASFMDVRGFGRGRGRSQAAEVEALVGTLPKVRIEVMVSDDATGAVVRAIADAAHTGQPGDGKVFVLPLDSALRISTSEQDAAAL